MTHRFGNFTFDTETRELRRDGAPGRLQAQPAEVLCTLLANPGQVVSRAALRDAVWGNNGTNVDFESGLNFCIAQLRSALGDSADSSIYIKTVPKQGYQFVAPVSPPSPPPALDPPAKLNRKHLIGLGLGVAALGIGGLSWWSLRTPPMRIAVARFQNQSGDPGMDLFADGLTDAIVAEFTTSPQRPDVIGNAAILRQARDFQDVDRIGRELNANYVILGQVQAGKILIHAIRIPDKAHVWVSRFETPLPSQSQIAERAARDFFAKMRDRKP